MEDKVSGGLMLRRVYIPLSPASAVKTVPEAGESNLISLKISL